MISGKIAHYTGNNRAAALDSKTALWAARMLVGEGYTNGKGEAVLWATMYRYLGMPKTWSSYQYMIRRFSQPINERWIPGGDLYEKYKNSSSAVYKQATSAAAVARRTKIQSMSWAEIPEAVKQIVGRFALGQIAPPDSFGGLKFSNFASYDGVDTKYPGGKFIGGDYFFVDPALKTNWHVEIIPNVGTPVPDIGEKKTLMDIPPTSYLSPSGSSYSGNSSEKASNFNSFIKSLIYTLCIESRFNPDVCRMEISRFLDNEKFWNDLRKDFHL